MIAKNEAERLWKVADMIYFRVMSHQFPGENEENHKKPELRYSDFWLRFELGIL
jgi:hypothetical protein